MADDKPKVLHPVPDNDEDPVPLPTTKSDLDCFQTIKSGGISVKSPPTVIQSPTAETAREAQRCQTLIVMRHGERLDDHFGKWFEKCRNKIGEYRQTDLNMPPMMAPLERALPEFENDTALTVMGQVLAQAIGRSLIFLDRSPDVVYCSPALRCIQTGATTASIGQRKVRLRIEPGLFENTDLYPDKKPKFLTAEQLQKANIYVDENYTPCFKLEDLFKEPESTEDYNKRIFKTLEYIVSRAAPEKGAVLIAAHASTVDLTYGLLHHKFSNKPRQTSRDDLWNIADRIPYCSNVVFMRKDNSSPWVFMKDAIPQCTYRNFCNKLKYDFIERTHSTTN